MKHYGDITKINGAEVPAVDIITGGSPCQDLSVAGKRAGLAGERSGLFMEQMRIVKEMRERERATGRTGWMVRPRYMVWENVPGAFSSGNPKGADFAAVIEEIIKVAEPGASLSVCVPNGGWTKSGCYYAKDGSWSIAWRVHDAQFWGVPQRRKRIALVADFGGLSAPEILFERKGLSGDSEQGKKAREKTSRTIGEGSDGTSWGIDHVITTGGNCTAKGPCVYEEVEASLKAGGPHAVFSAIAFGIDKAITTGGNCTAGGDCDTVSFQERGGKPGGGKEILIQHEHVGALSTLNNQSVLAYGIDQQGGKGGANYTEDVCPPILSDSHGTPHAVAYGISSYDSNAMKSPNPHYGDPCHPLAAGAHPPAVAIGNGQLNQMSMAEQANTLDTMHDQQAVMVFDKEMYNCGKRMQGEPQARFDSVAPTVRADSHPSGVCTSIVRRLTPLECERLQGYPDGWTDIGEWVDSKGKKHGEADSPRYKALGNSIALPFWQWMARRICAQYERTVTMASLFDGIGGFPLVFSRAGAVPVWASEIEEFPIAVTKVRFPDESV